MTPLQEASMKVAHLTTQPAMLEMAMAEGRGELNLTPREEMLLELVEAVTDLSQLALDKIKELQK